MKSERLSWRPGLEGLRGVAVLAVLLYHFRATHDLFPGGSLGVDVFFALSGFLITTLLLEERTRSGAISLAGFYRRRARRLLPALILFLAVFTVITLVARQPGADHLPVTVPTALFYVFNWVDDLGGTVTVGAGHLWSLSVEEQFYLLWPLIVIITLRNRPKALLWVSLVIFGISASLPAWGIRGYGEMYSGTDFRAQELMGGAILAQLRYSGVVTPSIVQQAPYRAALVLSVLFFALFVLVLDDRHGFLYAGLYTVTAVASVVLVCAALYAPPRLLRNAVIRYVGTRSYALYLWHHAIGFWLRGVDDVPALIVSTILSFAAAEISWRLVEQPGALARIGRLVRERFESPREKPAAVGTVVSPSPESASSQ